MKTIFFVCVFSAFAFRGFSTLWVRTHDWIGHSPMRILCYDDQSDNQPKQAISNEIYILWCTAVFLQVEAEDFSQELYSNVNMGSGNPLYERRGKQSYVSVLQGQLKYSSASREAANAKYSYVVSIATSLPRCFECRALRSSNAAMTSKNTWALWLTGVMPSEVETDPAWRRNAMVMATVADAIILENTCAQPGPVMCGVTRPASIALPGHRKGAEVDRWCDRWHALLTSATPHP